MKVASKAAIAALSSILLLGSSLNLAVEAAPSPASSDIALKTAAAKPKAESEGEKLEKEEIARINELLKKNPFDNYLTYSSFQPKGREVWGYSNGKGGYDKYEDYLKKVSSVKEARPQQPADLPEGYTFEEAQIIGPHIIEYTEEMKAEAKKLGKKIYSKKVDWTYTNYIVLTYTNGEDYIQLTSSRLENKDGKAKVKEKDYVYTSAEDMTKKHHMQLGNTLSWKEGGKGFSISTNPDNPLTKEDLIKLAKT
ncbi:hypothetical protein ABD76_19160, partial [Paenibacillus dendritiformis]|uniref:hypothetical protein n=1 Tax=Paenibacillus dendritiformis TaxID=130049 RepID=UPI0018CDD363